MALDRPDFYDAELARHNRHLRIAAGVGPGDRVLDIGCGAGQTTREAARAAPQGEAVGVDVSAEMLEVARQRSAAEGLRNVVFEQADAQSHAFPRAGFDLCISRFGVMFFADPAAAFANIGRAMRPGGRLVWMVWQSRERNAWSGAIRQALAPEAAISPGAPNPFSLGDPNVATELLGAAGFVSIDFAGVREPVFYGSDVEAAFDALISLYLVKDALAQTDETPDQPLQRLRDLLETHMTPQGVLFDSQAWIITARRAAG
ncbi:class I SAM-dependent methyltransferase [Rhizobium binae]|uniref:class I SAM-dependent methyltransferase n=1 Tax=Rhizobium binae TaxID=1138190 RepID=UPI001C8375E9|nr:class I SAM-dependent methyltransferase [Rhizobium binae]MBX4925265.1 methyltransferase domain-containing protein [Rhizobium binae]MBX4936220.1 methyltransferase domain-containing protein [Rhizobium binae]MBX4942537.1 methyltransferase domain-containing protein [Rhizobium binae]MBX4960405.1 methyltransferase domain-containing protein [Rhizobium binae]MBX4978150.1 methyltransferase domain-containing protein [Rhizobium binae]